MRLTINVVTRNRCHLLKQAVDSILKTKKLPTTKVMISADDDDPDTIEIARQLAPDVVLSVKPREDTLCEKMNRCLTAAPGDVYLFASDYGLFQNHGFDEHICDSAALFPDGIGVVNGPLANLSFSGVQCVTAKFAEFNGGVWPGYFPYWFGDHWIDDVARMIGRLVYAPAIVDTHKLRPGYTHRLRDVDFWATFFDATYILRHRIAEKMFDAMDDPQWRKDAQRRTFELTRQRSQILNTMVRNGKDHIHQSRGSGDKDDPHYDRAKARAEKLLLAIYDELVVKEGKAA